MSRIGNQPVTVPNGVEVKIDGTTVSVKGPKGELSQTFSDAVSISQEDGQLTIAVEGKGKEANALQGLTRSLIDNMVVGVSEGFSKQLELVGVGYRAFLKGKNLELQLGYSHPIVINAEYGIEFEVPSERQITVKGIDRQRVGQIAAEIRGHRPPEPYKGKDVRYVGEYVARKMGKAAK